MAIDLNVLDTVDPLRVEGRVRAVVGLSIRATVPGLRIGDSVEVVRRQHAPLLAEVVGFVEDEALLLPLGDMTGVGPDDVVRPIGHAFSIACGNGLLGRVVDGLGCPIDGGRPIDGTRFAVMRTPPDPMTRKRITTALDTGVRAIDGLLSVGEGQRVGLFAGSGVGKSSLLGQIARQTNADVFVICLIGERGREVREFIEDSLGKEGLSRGVVVCATSEMPALVRMKSAYVATAIAEWFRDQGKNVLLLMDSVTRFARAAREVGLAAGEPPARRGYPASVFAALPGLLERTGTSERGSITAFYSVLVEGGDMDEPIADEVRGILDGHIVLDRAIGARGHWPAINVPQSLSRLMESVTSAAHQKIAARFREHLAHYEAKRDLIALGAYKSGSDPRLDVAISKIAAMEAFLRQERTILSSRSDTLKALEAIG